MFVENTFSQSSEKEKMRDILTSVPKQYLSPVLYKSLMSLFFSLLLNSIIISVAVIFIPTPSLFSYPLWFLYSLLSGTCLLGLWVLAHECGHYAFSKSLLLNHFIGFILHSFLLVPYFSWKKSHFIHHKFPNHLIKGETHVPTIYSKNKKYLLYRLIYKNKFYKNSYLFLRFCAYFIFGWPSYLFFGATGGHERKFSNHFIPFHNNLFETRKEKFLVILSSIGVLAFLVFYIFLYQYLGFEKFLFIIVLPYLVVNFWLVLYTFLHHTDTYAKYFSNNQFTYYKGCSTTIDRNYGFIINKIHFNIGSTHFAHHIFPNIPHYFAKDVTAFIKNKYSTYYKYDSTPISRVLLRVLSECIMVKKVRKYNCHYYKFLNIKNLLIFKRKTKYKFNFICKTRKLKCRPYLKV